MNRENRAIAPPHHMAQAQSSVRDQIEQLAGNLRAHHRPKSRPFMALLTMLDPRIARMIRQYGLTDIRDDARQAAAIGVCRALSSYVPAKASFSTHVTWQIRGELQSLRHRMRLDQRRSAKNAGIATVSLDALAYDTEAGAAPFEIVDERACELTESGASDAMALNTLNTCLDSLDTPMGERAIVLHHVLGGPDTVSTAKGPSAEQRRQIVRRTMRNCVKVLAA